MGSRASGVQRDSSTPRSEGEARAELTQNVPNSSYEGKKKNRKVLGAGVSSLSGAGRVLALLAAIPSLSRASVRSL